MKYTEQQIITAMQGTGGIVSQIIKNLSKPDSNITITRQSLYERIEKNPTLKEAYQAEQERIGDIAETGFFRALQEEKEWAMKEWFKYKGYTRGYTQKIENDNNTNIIALILQQYSQEGKNNGVVDIPTVKEITERPS